MADTDCPWPRPGEKSKKPAAAGRNFRGSRDAVFVAVMALVTVALWFWPTGFEDRLPPDAVQVKARVLAVDDSHIHQYGIVREGEQRVTLSPLAGPFAGKRIVADNILLGKLELDKVFAPGDTALLVLSLRNGEIVSAVRGLTAGDADVPVPPAAADELGRVSEALHLL